MSEGWAEGKDDQGLDQWPTGERWHYLLEQLATQIADGEPRLRDEEWIRTEQVTDFERLMLFDAVRKLPDIRIAVAQQFKEPDDRRYAMTQVLSEEERLQKLNLNLDQVAAEVERRERLRVMLTKMAEALRSGHDPLDEAWLTEHSIVEPERSNLYQIVGGILYGYQASHVFVRSAVNEAAWAYIESPNTESWLQRDAIAQTALDGLRDVLKIKAK